MSSNFALLLVDDDPLIADALRAVLPKNCQLRAAQSLSEIPQSGFFHAAFVDLHLTKNLDVHEGVDAIAEIKRRFPKTEVIAISGDLNVKLMELCLAAGASKFLAKPLMPDELKATLEKLEALWAMRDAEQRPQQKWQWVGRSALSENLKASIANLRGEKGVILIEGETGSGKEVVAQLLHQQEPIRPLVVVNVAAIAENLFESEFFGHVRGAFTGADAMKIGLTEAANGGDLFLDEIEALPQSQQAKLLRFLETGEIRKVGGKETQMLKVRVIAATNQSLEKLAQQGQFREDLIFRLNSKKINLPPLRERKSEIAELAEFFLAKERPRLNKTMSPESLSLLQGYSWPGNVRELRRVCQQLALTAPLPIIRPIDVERLLASSNGKLSDLSTDLSLAEQLERFEAQLIRNCMLTAKSVDAAAEKLRISRSSLYKKMKDYGIEG